MLPNITFTITSTTSSIMMVTTILLPRMVDFLMVLLITCLVTYCMGSSTLVFLITLHYRASQFTTSTM